MLSVHALDCVGSSYHADHAQIATASCLQKIDGGAGASACGEHRIEDDDDAVGYIGRHLAVVFHRLMGLGIPVDTDVSDSRCREEALYAFHHSESGAEDGHQGDFLVGEDLERVGGDGSLDDFVDQRQVLGDFVYHQSGDFIHQFAEILGGGVFVTHQGKLVLNQRMIKNEYIFVGHDCFSF